ncbi:MAG: hypothetical protein RCG15_03775 [Candidatus Rickettsia vulgarisii]
MKIKVNKLFLLLFLCCSCTVGPKYFKPSIDSLPESFKEGGVTWKKSIPQDGCDRGKWWLIFNDPILNDLEDRLNINNQNVITAEAQYK